MQNDRKRHETFLLEAKMTREKYAVFRTQLNLTLHSRLTWVSEVIAPSVFIIIALIKKREVQEAKV